MQCRARESLSSGTGQATATGHGSGVGVRHAPARVHVARLREMETAQGNRRGVKSTAEGMVDCFGSNTFWHAWAGRGGTLLRRLSCVCGCAFRGLARAAVASGKGGGNTERDRPETRINPFEYCVNSEIVRFAWLFELLSLGGLESGSSIVRDGPVLHGTVLDDGP